MIEGEQDALLIIEVKYRPDVRTVPATMKHFAEPYALARQQKIIMKKQTMHKDASAVFLPAMMAPFVRWGEELKSF